jgi:hypothetical protein
VLSPVAASAGSESGRFSVTFSVTVYSVVGPFFPANPIGSAPKPTHNPAFAAGVAD